MTRGTRYVFYTGQKFGRLTVLEDKLNGFAHCVCECGEDRDFRKIDLRKGVSRSCGCWSADRSRKHGMDGTPTYNCWVHMLDRCRNPNNRMFPHYGARGISVCDRWHDFRNFLADMGEKPEGLSLDRIDNDGNYEPSNCRWASFKQQLRNRRVTVKATYQGKLMAISEIAEITGIDRKLLAARIKRGIPVEVALQTKKFSRWDKS